MTEEQMPHLGWEAKYWGPVRRWWVHRRQHQTGDYFTGHWWEHRDELEPDDEIDVGPPPAPEVASPAPTAWQRLGGAARIVGAWCAGALVLALVAPRWLLALALGAAGAVAHLTRRATRQQAAQLAQELERERATLAARANKEARRRANQAAHREEQADREAQRLAERGSEPDA